VNGYAAEEASFPYMAALLAHHKETFYNYCGGAITNDKFVLTLELPAKNHSDVRRQQAHYIGI